MILKNIKLRSELQKFISKAKEIEDILVFGSLMRGKEKPNDIDILVIFKNKIDKEMEYNLGKILRKYYPSISLISKYREDIRKSSFNARESVLFEGFSLLSGKNLAQEYGFNSFGMFKYDFSQWDKLQKTKFYYGLNGRRGEGISQKLDCIRLSDKVILVPLNKTEKFREFLESWNLESKYIPLLIPER